MANNYAQIDANSTCFAVTQASGPISKPDMISITSYDISLLGKTWSNGVWLDPEPPPAAEAP
jgi:predicted glycosyl hydrolase (DUF1957 family)